MIPQNDLLSKSKAELREYIVSLGEGRFRADQIFSWLMRGASFSEMSNIPKSLIARLNTECLDTMPRIMEKKVSAIDGTIKYLMGLHDGACVESVFMRYHHGNTLCISSQVGCRMGCKFCASTIGGKLRDLLPSELLGQIIAAERDTGERVSGIVMMGIGEPLDNYDNVIKFLRLVGDPDGLNIGYRHISLSTCGVVSGILALAEENFPITLSVSLHAATDAARSAIMPINNKWNISALLAACESYYMKTKRRISFEYTLISGKNDSPDDARALARLLSGAFKKSRAPLHVNLIRVNEVAETGFVRGSAESVKSFSDILNQSGVVATLRRRLGADINGACGQLRRNTMLKKQDKPQEDDTE